MVKMDESTAVLFLEVVELDALDDLLDLYLDQENERGVDRDVVLSIKGKVEGLMEEENRRLGFTDEIEGRDKYIM